MQIDPTRPSDPSRDYDYDPQPSTTPATTAPATATTTPRGPVSPDDAPDPLAGQSHGRASADFVRRATAASTDTGSAPRVARHSDSVLYLGMNSTGNQNSREAGALKADLRGTGAKLTVVARGETDPALGHDKIRLAGANGTSSVVDLGTGDGRATFVDSLHLPADTAARVVDVLASAAPGGRDELAGLAQVFARGEKGESMPSRLVLSGHSWGDRIYDGAGYGDENQVSFSSIKELAKAMPAAAGKIEDLMFSACSTGFDGAEVHGNRTALSSWKDAFPNLKTAWGYGTKGDVHTSPTGAGAQADIARWERATRGTTDHLHVNARHVSTWDARDGYRVGGGS
jgi:hypothetical protein